MALRIRVFQWFACLSLVTLVTSALVGCGGGEERITAANTKFQAVEGDGEGTQGSQGAQGGSVDNPETPDIATAPGVSSTDPAIADPGPANVNSDGTSASGAAQTPSSSGLPGGLPPTSPPADPAESLLAIAASPLQPPQGARSQQEAIQMILEQMAGKIQAAERVLAMKTSPESRMAAVEIKLGLLSQMVELQQPDADKHIMEFCRALEKDEQEDVAKLGRNLTTSLLIGEYSQQENGDFGPLRQRLKEAISDPDFNVQDLQATAPAALQLIRSGAAKEGREVVDMLQERFEGTDNSTIQLVLDSVNEQARVLETDLESKRDEFLDGSDESLANYVEVTRGLLKPDEKPGFHIFSVTTRAADDMERAGNLEEAKKVYDLLTAAYTDRDDSEMVSAMQDAVSAAEKRMNLVGSSLKLEGMRPDGTPLDPEKFQGSYVLIHFWTPQSQGSMEEFQYLLSVTDRFADRNLKILGVAVGPTTEVQRFFQLQQLPWDNIVDDGGEDGFAHACGVQRLPFSILVNPEGNVEKLYVMSPSLMTMLDATLPKAEGTGEAPAEDKPAKEKPVEEKPVEEKAGEEKAGEEKAGEEKSAEEKPGEEKAGEEKAGEAKSAGDKPAVDNDESAWVIPEDLQFVAVFDEPKEKEAGADQPSQPKLQPPLEEKPEEKLVLSKNPYLPRKGLGSRQLIDYIFDMEDRPSSIHRRPGFSEALIIAADKILQDDEALEKYQLIAIETKLWAYHRLSVAGKEGIDEQMYKYVDQLKNDERGRVARIVEFLQIEKRILEVDDLAIENVPDLLEEALSYCEEHELSDKQLRMASGIVHAINRMDDAEEREEWFKAMGGQFVKSDDRQLARYGKRIAKPKQGKGFSAVGKEMELAGVNVSGLPFDWSAYKGKVVVVDFWATWCGPCVREMPNVQAFYRKHRAQGLEIVGVSLDKDLDAVAAFVEDKKIPWETLVGEENQDIATNYGVRGIPTLMLVDRDGTIVAAAHNINGLAKKAEELLLNKQ